VVPAPHGDKIAVADWSPVRYLKFEDERTLPARDLLAHVSYDRVRKAVDVGCGPGNSTELLAIRFPEAKVTGIDNSPAMLEEARRRLPNLRFEFADASVWSPEPDTDLVFGNATFHWIPHHLEVLTRVFSALPAGATLAVQMPDNTEEPTHRLMREVALARPWSASLTSAVRDPLPSVRAYYAALRAAADRLDVWRTTYHHVLPSAAAIVEFVRATGLRRFLDPLREYERVEFLAMYTDRIAAAYPPLADGNVLLAFPRLFIVAQRCLSRAT
jgi:trans-aconitate 2-methyltransferase